eukprot:g37272.t1
MTQERPRPNTAKGIRKAVSGPELPSAPDPAGQRQENHGQPRYPPLRTKLGLVENTGRLFRVRRGMVTKFVDDTKTGGAVDSEEGHLRVQQDLDQ